HDVSDVRAHVAGPAAHASHAMGAAAYAVGDRVAFGATPDLRTAAHEAAHVVQQRAGVDVAAHGNRHEQHADAVADRVAQGGSAEALLDAFAGNGRPDRAAVQRLAFLNETQVHKSQKALTADMGSMVS